MNYHKLPATLFARHILSPQIDAHKAAQYVLEHVMNDVRIVGYPTDSNHLPLTVAAYHHYQNLRLEPRA